MPRKPRNLQSGYSLKVFAKGTNRRRRTPQSDRTGVVSCWLGFISPIRLQQPTLKKSKSRLVQILCQVSVSPELTRIVSQFIEANRAPWQVEKDF